MKKQLVIIEIVALIVIAGFLIYEALLDTLEKNKFVGEWHENIDNTVYMYCFNSDKTFDYDSNVFELQKNGSWELQNGKFVMTYPRSGNVVTYDYSFSHNDQILILFSKEIPDHQKMLYKQN